MINLLKNWNGSVEVNGKQYSHISEINVAELTATDVLSIKLYPAVVKTESTTTKTTVESAHESSGEIEITVKKYMTEHASPEFDFMVKWNNDNPMPLRTMTGTVVKETRGMVYMKLHGVGRAEVCCMRCGRNLTNPISRHYGIGPECMQKIGFIGIEIDAVDLIKEKLQNVTWEGWIIKSAITDRREV